MRRLPPSNLLRGLLTAVLLAAILAPSPGRATEEREDTRDRLDAVQRALERSRAEAERLGSRASDLRRQTETYRQQMILAAAAIQDHEANIGRLDAEIAELDAAAAERLDQLKAERGRFAQVLLALQRMARYPPEALIAQPLDPNDMVRGAILLRAAVPAVEQRAASLRAELASLTDLRARLERRRTERDEAGRALERERKRLAGLADRRAAESQAAEAARKKAVMRAEVLSREARDLQELVAKLEKERAARLAAEESARREAERKAAEEAARAAAETRVAAVPPPPAPLESPAPALPISKARGTMPMPAVGPLVGTYGERLDSGLSRKGIVIETLPGAQVVAPYDGAVAYAGTFRGYGLVLIIEHGEGYHTLLTGMSRIDAVIGQRVVAGEPVGVMGQPTPEPPNLYVELRRDGQPINPLPWMTARNRKVSG